MSSDSRSPEYAVLGHPNEGKSSVVSTLAEDDTVKVSATPGETRRCQSFPVMVDGEEIIRFTDTPGFQVPGKTLAWFREYSGNPAEIVRAFIAAHEGDPLYADECELLSPVARGAGILYVVDASRPVRRNDRAEMEILRMTGCPRMAIINSKRGEVDHTESWKNEFRRSFNAFRVFNAHNANYAERLLLLESLKGIDQDWERALERVITAYRDDWARRNLLCSRLMAGLLGEALRHTTTRRWDGKGGEKPLREALLGTYQKEIAAIEKEAQQKIRRLFKHNIFNLYLPEQSILHHDLFDSRTWQVLGLSPKQLVAAAAAAGGAIGACLDLAAAGLSFGIFTALGSIAAAGSALAGGEKIARTRVVGVPLGGYRMAVGPAGSVQFLYVLLDRALLFYAHVINWAHGRRERVAGLREAGGEENQPSGYSSRLSAGEKEVFNRFFKAVSSGKRGATPPDEAEMTQAIYGVLERISRDTF